MDRFRVNIISVVHKTVTRMQALNNWSALSFVMIIQDVTKRLSDSPGLVKQSVGLAPCYHRLPDEQALTGHE